MEVNYIAVVVAALAAFFLGYLWYTVVFARAWKQLIGMGEEAKGTSETPNLGRLLVGSLILEIVMAAVLAQAIGDGDAAAGLLMGLTVGIGFVGLALAVNYLFEGKSFKLWLINAGYNIVVFGVMGLIIGAM